jgi:hypothetical protein
MVVGSVSAARGIEAAPTERCSVEMVYVPVAQRWTVSRKWMLR